MRKNCVQCGKEFTSGGHTRCGSIDCSPTPCPDCGQPKNRRSKRCMDCGGPQTMVIAFGETKTIKEWSNDPRCSVTPSSLARRLKKSHFTVEQAITLPAKSNTRLQYFVCEECEGGFETRVIRSDVRFCSGLCSHRNWVKTNPEEWAAIERRKEVKRRMLLEDTEVSLTSDEWRDILEMWNYECVYCGAPWKEMDHWIPISRGGTHTADNVVPACKSCNRRKHAKMPLEFIGCG